MNQELTNLLSKLNAGIEVTKEYATELFSRYVRFLIVQDALYSLVCLVFLIIGIVVVRKNPPKEEEHTDSWGRVTVEKEDYMLWCGWLLIGLAVILLSVNLYNLSQDVFLPEIRILSILRGK